VYVYASRGVMIATSLWTQTVKDSSYSLLSDVKEREPGHVYIT
jgi:hypothetical protein